jgi:Holliday junction resolvasome RuvABC ATP-dependent DNA helicase subunit
MSKFIVTGSIAKYFPNYVGQMPLTSHLASMIEARKRNPNAKLRPQFFGGLAGSGKSELAKAIAKALAPEGFEFIELQNSITLPQLMQLWADCIQGKQCVIFVDEAHNISNKKVLDVMKRLTELGSEVCADVRCGDTFLQSDLRNHFWIAASNMDATDEALFGPTGRFQCWTLQPLSYKESEELLLLMAKAQSFQIHKPAIELLLSRTMPNGRSIRAVIDNIGTYCPKGVVSLEHAKELVKQAQMFPLGLQSLDLKVLQFVEADIRGKQIQEISAACGGEDRTKMAQRVNQLCGLGLMQTNTSGRKGLTEKGVEYLKNLRELQKVAKAKAKAKAEKEKGAKDAPAKLDGGKGETK